METEEVNLEAVPPEILDMLGSTIGKLLESQARAEEIQELLDLLTKEHANEGCAACEKRSNCQANGCKGSHVSAKRNALGMEIVQRSANLVTVGTKVRRIQRMSSAVRTCVWRSLSLQGMSWRRTLERQGRTE